jgi:hypothetical protein
MKTFLLALPLMTLIFAGCGGEEPTGADEQGLKAACTRFALYCPADQGCTHVGGGCPQKCLCPSANNKVQACGPKLRCTEDEVCCTGPGPVSIDPSQNQYSCNPPGSACPL